MHGHNENITGDKQMMFTYLHHNHVNSKLIQSRSQIVILMQNIVAYSYS